METNQELANPALEGCQANWRTKPRNQVEEFAGAPMKQERELMAPLGDGGMGTAQNGEKKQRHECRWIRSRASRLQGGGKWSNTMPPRRLLTPTDAAVAKLSPRTETSQSKQTSAKW
jgi:hypothetical protein